MKQYFVVLPINLCFLSFFRFVILSRELQLFTETVLIFMVSETISSNTSIKSFYLFINFFYGGTTYEYWAEFTLLNFKILLYYLLFWLRIYTLTYDGSNHVFGITLSNSRALCIENTVRHLPQEHSSYKIFFVDLLIY